MVNGLDRDQSEQIGPQENHQPQKRNVCSKLFIPQYIISDTGYSRLDSQLFIHNQFGEMKLLKSNQISKHINYNSKTKFR